MREREEGGGSARRVLLSPGRGPDRHDGGKRENHGNRSESEMVYRPQNAPMHSAQYQVIHRSVYV